jgi:DNA-binding transcriptional MerR regulator
MTEQKLTGYVFIKARIEEIEERIAELDKDIAELEQENGLGSVNMDGMPHGSTPGDPVARMAIARATLQENKKKLKVELEYRRAELVEKEREIREYIDSVEDEEVKLIIEWRFIDLLDWYEIAGKLEEMTGKNVDRSTPGKKMRRYLQEH